MAFLSKEDSVDKKNFAEAKRLMEKNQKNFVKTILKAKELEAEKQKILIELKNLLNKNMSQIKELLRDRNIYSKNSEQKEILDELIEHIHLKYPNYIEAIEKEMKNTNK